MKHAIPSIGLVGISGYGRVYLRFLEAAIAKGAIRLVAAVVINRQEEQEACARLEALGVTLYDDWQSMLDDQRGKLDLCLIPVPIHLHERIAVAAMEAGANVLVEKPLAASVEQVKSIQATERRTGKWVAVGYQDFYCPSVHAIRRDLEAGRIGRVKAIHLLGLWPRSLAYYNRSNWSGKLALDGFPVLDSPLHNAMAHFLNLSLFWSGKTPLESGRAQTVTGELFRCFPIESFDTAVVRVRTESKIVIHAAVTHCCPVARPIHIQIVGDKGKMNWAHRRDAVWVNEQGEKDRLLQETGEEAVDKMFKTVLARLYSPDARICTTDLALPQVACIEAMQALPIRNISPANIDDEKSDGGTSFVIRNVEEDFRSCLRVEALPSELDLKWAIPSPVEPASLVSS